MKVEGRITGLDIAIMIILIVIITLMCVGTSKKPVEPVPDPAPALRWQTSYLGKTVQVGGRTATVVSDMGRQAEIMFDDRTTRYIDWMAVANQHASAPQPEKP
jgi:hypothetical protein